MCIIIILLHRKKFKDKTSMIKIHTEEGVIIILFFQELDQYSPTIAMGIIFLYGTPQSFLNYAQG